MQGNGPAVCSVIIECTFQHNLLPCCKITDMKCLTLIPVIRNLLSVQKYFDLTDISPGDIQVQIHIPLYRKAYLYCMLLRAAPCIRNLIGRINGSSTSASERRKRRGYRRKYRLLNACCISCKIILHLEVGGYRLHIRQFLIYTEADRKPLWILVHRNTIYGIAISKCIIIKIAFPVHGIFHTGNGIRQRRCSTVQILVGTGIKSQPAHGCYHFPMGCRAE